MILSQDAAQVDSCEQWILQFLGTLLQDAIRFGLLDCFGALKF